jgi:hypothetical protein
MRGRAYVCLWHIASFRCDAEFGRYRRIADMDHAEQIAAQAVEAADPTDETLHEMDRAPRASRLRQSCWPEAASLWPVRHYLFNLASELSKMGGEALVKLPLLLIRRASRDLFGKVSFGAQLLRAGLHVLHRPSPLRLQPGRCKLLVYVRGSLTDRTKLGHLRMFSKAQTCCARAVTERDDGSYRMFFLQANC